MKREENNSILIWIAITISRLLLNFIGFGFLSFYAVELFTVASILVVGTPGEEVFFRLVSYTPGLGLKGNDTFILEAAEVVKFFSFISLVLMAVGSVLSLVFKRKRIKFSNFKTEMVLYLIVHLTTVVKAMLIAEFDLLPFILGFMFLGILSRNIYKILRSISQSLETSVDV